MERLTSPRLPSRRSDSWLVPKPNTTKVGGCPKAELFLVYWNRRLESVRQIHSIMHVVGAAGQANPFMSLRARLRGTSSFARLPRVWGAIPMKKSMDAFLAQRPNRHTFISGAKSSHNDRRHLNCGLRSLHTKAECRRLEHGALPL